jgi:glycosyltransferase involved in cell wall biosynthesis
MDRPIKILHVVRSLQVGGLEKLVLEMCRRAQGRQDVQMAVCSLVAGDGIADLDRYRSVRTFTLARSYEQSKLGAFRAMVRLLRAERPDVLHTHNLSAQFYGAPAARLVGVPVVVCTRHGTGSKKVWGSLALASLVWRMADQVVPVSDDAAGHMEANYGIGRGKTRVILNGVDTDVYRPSAEPREAARARVLGATGRPVVGTVCRMIGYKGIDTLLEAFAILRREEPQAALVLVGDGADRAGFEEHARKLGLGDSARFLGVRNDVKDIYPLLDVFVLASWLEGIPLTLLEAAACGVPVVVTAVGGMPQVTDNGAAGLLVPPRDAGTLAAAILSIHRQPELAARLALAGRQRVVERFSLDRMTRDYIDVYRELYAAKVGNGGAA